MARKRTLPGKVYPFNKELYKMLDAEDKIAYKKSHANRSKKRITKYG